MKIKPIAAGLAFGVFWGVALFIFTVASMYTGFMETQLSLLIGAYPYYEITWTGAVAGLVDGLLDGFVVGFIIALLYNAFASCCGGKKKKIESQREGDVSPSRAPPQGFRKT